MADRYQDRPFPTDADHDRGANPCVRGESDPLAELIGQTDPFGTPAKPPVCTENLSSGVVVMKPAQDGA
jgi:hypothetical protein